MTHLHELARPEHDRKLDMTNLLKALVEQGRLSQEGAEQLSMLRRTASGTDARQHPLEFIAGQAPEDLDRPGKALDMESLTRWLASESRQPFYRIDPLKINVSAVTPLMSFAFAQRHGILAVDVNEREVTIASAQPFVRNWEADLTHVLKRDIRRVVASPTDIQRYSLEFYRLGRSPGSGNRS